MSSAFVQAAVILLREGLEAMLVIAALAGYLTKAGAGSSYQGAICRRARRRWSQLHCRLVVCGAELGRPQRRPGRRYHSARRRPDALRQRLVDGEAGSARLAGISRAQGRSGPVAGYDMGGRRARLLCGVPRGRRNRAIHQCAGEDRRRLERRPVCRPCRRDGGPRRAVLFHQPDRAEAAAAAAVHHHLGVPVCDGDQVHRRGGAGIPGTGDHHGHRGQGLGIPDRDRPQSFHGSAVDTGPGDPVCAGDLFGGPAQQPPDAPGSRPRLVLPSSPASGGALAAFP